MEIALYVFLGLLGLVIIYWLVRLIWFRPLNIEHFFVRVFLRVLFENPELLTMLGILEKIGIHGHNAKLANASDAYETKTYRHLHRSLRQLRGYRRERLPAGKRLSADVLDWFMEDQARSERFRYHNYPVNQMFGAQSNLPNFMLTMHPLVSGREARNYVRRLRRFGVRFDQVLEGLRIRESRGCIPPRFVIRRVLDEMTAFIGQPATENPLYTVMREKLAGLKLDERIQAGLLADTERAIREVVYPAYQRLIDYFTALEQRATDDDGVWKLPDGEAYYAECLRSNTTTDLSPEEVHQIGLREVERIESEMAAIFARLGETGVHGPKRLLELSQDERFLYPNTDEGREAALAEYKRILDHVNASLEPLFDLRPKAGMDVRRVPEFREKTSAGAYYQPPDLGGGRPGVFYANLRDMKEVPKFGMRTLAYHEGIPGHHFQIAIAMELKGVPFFRRMIPFTAYAEGWALYAEKLMREQGLLADDPYSELGYLDSELFRAVRLVVDTGLHFKRWTRQQAIDYMQAHTAMALESIVSEVERYIVMPGQACAYKIGEIRIVELREKARRALGEKFDLRQFHNAVLRSGSLPLSLLERIVDEHIAARQAA